MSGKHAVSRSIYWQASNMISLPYHCFVCWLQQSSGEWSNKLDSASKFMISSAAGVANDINCLCCRRFRLKTLGVNCTNKLIQQHSTKMAQFRFGSENDEYSQETIIVISYSKSSYISRSSLWSVGIAETKHVAQFGFLTKEILFLNREVFWAIVRIDEKPSRKMWLST